MDGTRWRRRGLPNGWPHVRRIGRFYSGLAELRDQTGQLIDQQFSLEIEAEAVGLAFQRDGDRAPFVGHMQLPSLLTPSKRPAVSIQLVSVGFKMLTDISDAYYTVIRRIDTAKERVCQNDC